MAKTFKTDGSVQMFAPGTTVRPVYGLGARTYGGANVRGRTAQVQFREQNSGMAPAEDYSPAKFLPGLWRDLDRNGVPYVIPGGTVLGVAGVVNASGETFVLSHQVMPANAGVPQHLAYGADLDTGIAIDIDSMMLAADYVAPASQTRVAGAVTRTTLQAVGNKPLAYTPTNVLSLAWTDVFANKKYEQTTTMKTQWLAMYPVSDRFMYGGAVLAASGETTVDALGSANVPSSTRAGLGFAPVTIANNASITLAGIGPGDYVMPNPYLPGKLISVDDFVTLALADVGAGSSVGLGGAGAGLNDVLVALIGTVNYASARAYAMEHVVGRCFKRQSRATIDTDGTVINKDIYADVLSYLVQVPQLNLQGQSSSGIEANQEDGMAFAKAVGSGASIDVVFINFCIK